VEPFVDFGLFEVVTLIGLAALARTIYSRKWLAVVVIGASVAAPAAMLVLAFSASQRLVAAVSLATALVNAAVLAAVVQAGSIPKLKLPSRRKPQRGMP